MRTTLSVDEDVLERARALAARLKRPFRVVINEALRAGLETLREPAARRRYETEPRALGLREGVNLDNIQELLADLEGHDRR